MIWKDAEEQFKSWWQGKQSFCFQFLDTRAAMGALGTKRVFAAPHPSDFLVTDRGHMFYAEVKSFSGDSFKFSNVQPAQWSAARQQIAAGGEYFFYLFATGNKQWYKLSASVLLKIYDAGRKSVRVAELLEYQMTPPQ